MYERFLPSFKVVEINNSTAHRIGHAISQVPCYKAGIAHVTVNEKYDFIENGTIVGLSADGELRLENYNPEKHSQPCLVYNDELITGPIDTLDKYAEEMVDGKAYVRALPLYLGDSFTTDNYSGVMAEGYAVVDGGHLVKGDAGMFYAKEATLPNGKKAFEFTYIGLPMAEAAE